MERPVGFAPDGSQVRQVTLRGGGLTARVLTWGATVQGLWLDDVKHSLLLGSPDLRAYFRELLYFGAVVGPVANRIAGARFPLGGHDVRLEANERGRTTLHGGTHGTGQRNWRIADLSAAHCRMEIEQPDGYHGFPGPIRISVDYALEDMALSVVIRGESDGRAAFAPAFHGYWNLDGAADLSGHRLQVDAADYLPVDGDLIPLGAPAPVAGTVFDFRMARGIDRHIDHNLCLSGERRRRRPVARLETDALAMTVETTEPGLQVYASGGTDSGPWPGHDGKPFGTWAGVALEPQVWPDAVNRPTYPSPRIAAREPVTQETRFVFARVKPRPA
ncbi:MAG: galactose mutarotase [Pseudooceanicola sp.]|nr:galactose mutarotase [Pseudooceanicola sp.]